MAKQEIASMVRVITIVAGCLILEYVGVGVGVGCVFWFWFGLVLWKSAVAGGVG